MSHTIHIGTWIYQTDLLTGCIYDQLLDQYNVKNDMPLIEHDINKGIVKITYDQIYHLDGIYHIDKPLQKILKEFEEQLQTKPIKELKLRTIEIEIIEPHDENTTGIIKLIEEK